MKEKLKGHSAMFTANFLWGIMSPISKSIFFTGVISAFSLTNMRMIGAAAFFWIASLVNQHAYDRGGGLLLDCLPVYAS